MLVRMNVGVIVPGAVGPAMPTVHRAVQGVDACICVLLLRGPLRRAAYVQDFGVVPFPSLTLPQLPGLGLDPDGEDYSRLINFKKLGIVLLDNAMPSSTIEIWSSMAK